MVYLEPPTQLTELLLSLPTRKRQYPKLVKCPKCKHIGIVQAYKQSRNRGIGYVVGHENIEGTWCKVKKSKIRRCFSFDEIGKNYLADMIRLYEERQRNKSLTGVRM